MEPGLRERKKRRSRDALVAAALDLFQRHGYDETTVAQIAAAAELSTRTFFLHFPTKEDVLLANTETRLSRGVRAIHDNPGSVPEALRAALGHMIADADATDVPSGAAQLRARLLATNPALQARLFQRLFTGQNQLIDALTGVFPQLDPIEAAARVGAAVGAVNAAMLASLSRGDDPEQQRAAMARAAAIATG